MMLVFWLFSFVLVSRAMGWSSIYHAYICMEQTGCCVLTVFNFMKVITRYIESRRKVNREEFEFWDK